jgi:hypothetical protein
MEGRAASRSSTLPSSFLSSCPKKVLPLLGLVPLGVEPRQLFKLTLFKSVAITDSAMRLGKRRRGEV